MKKIKTRDIVLEMIAALASYNIFTNGFYIVHALYIFEFMYNKFHDMPNYIPLPFTFQYHFNMPDSDEVMEVIEELYKECGLKFKSSATINNENYKHEPVPDRIKTVIDLTCKFLKGKSADDIIRISRSIANYQLNKKRGN